MNGVAKTLAAVGIIVTVVSIIFCQWWPTSNDQIVDSQGSVVINNGNGDIHLIDRHHSPSYSIHSDQITIIANNGSVAIRESGNNTEEMDSEPRNVESTPSAFNGSEAAVAIDAHEESVDSRADALDPEEVDSGDLLASNDPSDCGPFDPEELR